MRAQWQPAGKPAPPYKPDAGFRTCRSLNDGSLEPLVDARSKHQSGSFYLAVYEPSASPCSRVSSRATWEMKNRRQSGPARRAKTAARPCYYGAMDETAPLKRRLFIACPQIIGRSTDEAIERFPPSVSVIQIYGWRAEKRDDHARARASLSLAQCEDRPDRAG